MSDRRTDEELSELITAAAQKVAVGSSYVHYRQRKHVYRVIALGFIESTEKVCVIYQSQQPNQLTWVRELDDWLATVKWNGREVPRFQKVE